MHIIRNAILAGALTIFVPWAGVAPQLSAIAHDAKGRLSELVQTVVRDANRDFRVEAVRIHAEPSSPSTVVGLGNPGDRVKIHERVPGDAVTCADGATTTEWARVTDRGTQVSGYVAQCYI